MALNNSGPLSFGGSTVGQSINLELGVSATALASINSTAFRTLAGVASGQISVSNFYGKSNTPGGWSFSTGGSTPFQVSAAYVDPSNNDVYITAQLTTFSSASPFKFNAAGVRQWGVTFTDANSVRMPDYNIVQTAVSYYTDGSATINSYIDGSPPSGVSAFNMPIAAISQRFNSSGSRTFTYRFGFFIGNPYRAYNYFYSQPARNASYTVLQGSVYTFFDYTCECNGQGFRETQIYNSLVVLNSGGAINGAFYSNDNAGNANNQIRNVGIDSSNNMWVNISRNGNDCRVTRANAATPTSQNGQAQITCNAGNFYELYGTFVTAGAYVWNLGIINVSSTSKGFQLYIIRFSGSVGPGIILQLSWSRYLLPPVRNSIQQASCIYGAVGAGNSSTGDLYIASRANSGQGLFGLIARYDVNGTLQWARALRVSSSTIPNTTGGSSSVYVSTIQLDTANSVAIVAGWFQVGDSGGSNTRSQGFVLRLPIDGSKTGNITIPYPLNTSLSTILLYEDLGGTNIDLQAVSGTSGINVNPINNQGGFYQDTFAPTTTASTAASAVTVSF